MHSDYTRSFSYRFGGNVLKTIDQLLFAEGLGVCDMNGKNAVISREVHKFLTSVAESMNAIDPHLGIRLCLGGSSIEGTKTGLCDEFDYRFHITGLQRGNSSVVKELLHSVQLKINAKHIALKWKAHCDEDSNLLARPYYDYVYGILYQALAKVKLYKTFRKRPFYFKSVVNEQIHLEWVGKPDDGMAIKIDAVFAVTMTDWWPSQARQQSILIQQDHMRKETNLILRRTGWKPSTCLQEIHIMHKLPPVPKYAYMLCKIINSIVQYSKSEQPNKVKSYTLKNALLHTLEDTLEDKNLNLEEAIQMQSIVGASTMKLIEGCFKDSDDLEFECDIELIRQWVLKICEQCTGKVTSGEKFYFGIGSSTVYTPQLTRYLNMVDFLLGTTEFRQPSTHRSDRVSSVVYSI